MFNTTQVFLPSLYQVLRASVHEKNQGNLKSLYQTVYDLSQVSNPKSLKQPGLIIEIIEYTTPSSNHRVSFDEQELMGW